MLIIFFDIKGILHKEFVLAGQTVPHTTVRFYGDCMKMCEDFTLNFSVKTTGCCTTTAHRLTLPFLPGNFFTTNNMTVGPQPPNFPDLVPCNFSMFPQLKRKLKGSHFDTIEVIEA
jgi:hypothetical protein